MLSFCKNSTPDAVEIVEEIKIKIEPRPKANKNAATFFFSLFVCNPIR
jgi:hypothetical protein